MDDRLDSFEKQVADPSRERSGQVCGLDGSEDEIAYGCPWGEDIIK